MGGADSENFYKEFVQKMQGAYEPDRIKGMIFVMIG
jgi:hypothetical protein